MHWTAKMQKNATGACNIIETKICSTKQTSKPVFNVSRLKNSQIEIFHKNAKFLSNYSKL